MKYLALALLFASSTSFASVIKNYDHKNSCNLYRVLRGDEKANYKPATGDEVVVTKDVYGLATRDLEINFNNRNASAIVMINIALGMNRQLVSFSPKIESDHKDFAKYINQLNRKATLIQKICINRDNTIVYFDY